MKPFCRIDFRQKNGVKLDVPSFQEAIRFPLTWRAHFRFDAFAYKYDSFRERFEEAYIRLSIARCSFVNRSGDFAWNAFHAFLDKLENRLERYGFAVSGDPLWTSDSSDYNCHFSPYYTPSAVKVKVDYD